MRKNFSLAVHGSIMILSALFFTNSLIAQQQTSATNPKSDFWNHVQFGGGIGLSIGSGYTDVFISPSAIYNINPTFAVGTALQFGYINSKNNYESFTYGGSIIGLANPIPQIQLSAELEQLRFNTDYKSINNYGGYSDNFWNTALYLGAGYRTRNVTIGFRYDILHDNNSLYNDPFTPFVRVYF